MWATGKCAPGLNMFIAIMDLTSLIIAKIFIFTLSKLKTYHSRHMIYVNTFGRPGHTQKC